MRKGSLQSASRRVFLEQHEDLTERSFAQESFIVALQHGRVSEALDIHGSGALQLRDLNRIWTFGVILTQFRDASIEDFRRLATWFSDYGLPLDSKELVGDVVILKNARMVLTDETEPIHLDGMYVLYDSRENLQIFKNICARDLWAIHASMLDMSAKVFVARLKHCCFELSSFYP